MFKECKTALNDSVQLLCMVLILIYFWLINLTMQQDNAVLITACDCRTMTGKLNKE